MAAIALVLPPNRAQPVSAMLQDFDVIKDPSVGPPRVALLRAELAREDLDGYIVAVADEHQGEYVPRSSQRLSWLSGFTGSAGHAVILRERAAMFSDGRYTVQVRAETDPGTFEYRQVPNERLSAWLTETSQTGARIGFDAKLFTIGFIEGLEKALAKSGIVLVALGENLVDRIWTDRPQAPVGEVSLQPREFTGRDAEDKIAAAQKALAEAGEDAAVLTDPASIAWLLNIRGQDVPHTPFALSFAILHRTRSPELFIDPAKLRGNVRDAVAKVATLANPNSLTTALAALGKAKVRLDASSAAQWFANELKRAGAEITQGLDPCLLPRARKSPEELSGARAAQARDAVAVCQFLAWFDRESPSGKLDEIAAARKLEAFRNATGALIDLSFGSISAAGANAALPHYHPTTASNAPILPNSVYLIDSGGQYRDGTTDITRTIAVGTPPEEARTRATLVLKGMIAISVSRFPKGTRGQDLDPFARRALWDAGLDFDHGTGHGVGSFLSVHEGPQRIARTGTQELEPGMIISNEPGFYQPGAYGIRIENLVVVQEPAVPAGGDRPMLSFETLTFVPIDRRMVDVAMLRPDERQWVDAYHAEVFARVSPGLNGADLAWLTAATKPL